MQNNKYSVDPDKLKGKVVEDLAVTSKAVVIKFTDNTFLDIYLDSTGKWIKTSTNQLK